MVGEEKEGSNKFCRDEMRIGRVMGEWKEENEPGEKSSEDDEPWAHLRRNYKCVCVCESVCVKKTSPIWTQNMLQNKLI